eukprot:506759_1
MKSPICIERECTVTCNGGTGMYGDSICGMAKNAVNKLFPGEIDKLVCEIHANGNGKICKRAPIATTTSTSLIHSTLPPIKVTSTTYSTTKHLKLYTETDMSCKTEIECETKASYFGWTAINPTNYQERYICRHNMRTVTCNNYNVCPNLQNAMNTEFSTNHVVKCEKDSTGTQQICIVSTSTA